MKKKLFAVGLLISTCFSTPCFSGEKVNHHSYFDSATGHTYERLDNFTYAEFSKKGKFLKKVPSNLPLLLKSPSVHSVPVNSFILYEKGFCGKPEQKLLPKNMDHPKGWMAKKIFVAIN